jgi:divalent metal cation (Fe/Co/Zn/Cd) transporter
MDCSSRNALTDTHESAWGILIGLVAKIGMPILAAYKLKVAARLNSRALRADPLHRKRESQHHVTS